MLVYIILINIMSIGVNLEKYLSILFSRNFLISLLGCILIYKNSLYNIFLYKGVTFFGGLYFLSNINNTFNIFLLIISLLIGFITSFYPRKVFLKEKLSVYKLVFYNFIFNKNKILNILNEQYKILEYTLILLFIILGGVFLMSANDLISLFLSIELQSYGLYILSSVYRNSESSTSAGLTYFLLGSFSSCFILLSTSLLYSNLGNTSLDGFYIVSGISDTIKEINTNSIHYLLYVYNSYYIHFSLVILSIGFLFKISAAPFHFWSPDVYDGVPTVVTTFISIIAKITILIFLLELINNTYSTIHTSDFGWTSTFIISSFLSFVIGAILGLTQIRIKRLLAYSSISHIGFILLVLSIKSIISIQAFLFYLIQYTITSLNSFLILISKGYSLYNYVYKNDNLNDVSNVKEKDKSNYKDINEKEKNNSPIQLIDQLKGYFYVNPYLSISLAITFFSFIGIPPLIGFFAKFLVLFASINNGYTFLSIIAIITSVISGVYYLIVIKKIFFENTDYIVNPSLSSINLFGILKTRYNNIKVNFNISNIILSSPINIIISIITLIILLFIFFYYELLNIISFLSLSYIY